MHFNCEVTFHSRTIFAVEYDDLGIECNPGTNTITFTVTVNFEAHAVRRLGLAPVNEDAIERRNAIEKDVLIERGMRLRGGGATVIEGLWWTSL